MVEGLHTHKKIERSHTLAIIMSELKTNCVRSGWGFYREKNKMITYVHTYREQGVDVLFLNQHIHASTLSTAPATSTRINLTVNIRDFLSVTKCSNVSYIYVHTRFNRKFHLQRPSGLQ